MKASKQNYLDSTSSKDGRFMIVFDPSEGFDNIEDALLIFDTKKAIIWKFANVSESDKLDSAPTVWRQFVRYVDGNKPNFKPAKKWFEKIRAEKRAEKLECDE